MIANAPKKIISKVFKHKRDRGKKLLKESQKEREREKNKSKRILLYLNERERKKLKLNFSSKRHVMKKIA